MKSPCINCLCLPICGNKMAMDAFLNCILLQNFIKETKPVDKFTMVYLQEMIKSGKLIKEEEQL